MPKSPGRPKGVPNKLTAQARDVISNACERIGGARRLAEWVRENPKNETLFWTVIYPRLLPLEVNSTGTGTVAIGVQIVRYSDDKVINGYADEVDQDPARLGGPTVPAK